MQTFDFGRSFLRFRIDLVVQPTITVTHDMPTTVNNVRINVESRCEIIERKTQQSTIFMLGASCKTERVGAERHCWLEPNADFCLIMSEHDFLIFKSWAQILPAPESDEKKPGTCMERQSGVRKDAWVDSSAQLSFAPGRRLDSVDAIIRAIEGDNAIVGHTEYDIGDFRVILDYPVKTINFSERELLFQTSTGPIIVPDLSSERRARCARLIDCFDLAFVASGKNNWAEFIINVPTSLGNDIYVNHYSRTQRIESALNSLIEVTTDGRAEVSPVMARKLPRASRIQAQSH